MTQQVIEHRATTKAAPAAVFALLADGSTWPSWSPLGSFELIEPGEGTPEGMGAVRVFRTGRRSSREKVVRVQPNEVFSYELLSGLPIRHYVAVVTLQPEGGGTAIFWRSTFHAKVPGTGRIIRRELDRFIGQTVAGLAKATSDSVLG
jgi:polyketide cyclase/dehydrase/lipid transport protein